MPTDSCALLCTVSGRVQGVYYRSATRERAVDLGLRGWVRNLSDRRVEVLAAGERDAVAALAAWLWRGPPAARVEAVGVEQWQGAVPDDFSIR